MKKIFVTLFFCMISLCTTSNAVAVVVAKPVFIMDIPTKMTLAREEEADKLQHYTYLYVYSPEPLPADISTLQTLRKILPTQQLMEITAEDSFLYSSVARGSTVQDYNARASMYRFLGNYFQFRYGKDITQNQNLVRKEIAEQPIQHFKLNHHTFSLYMITLDNTNAYFLSAATKNTVYLIKLMSTSPDPIIRKKQMDEMMASVGTIQLLGIPGLG